MHSSSQEHYWYQRYWFRNLVVGTFVVFNFVVWFFFLVIVPIVARDAFALFAQVRTDVAKYCGYDSTQAHARLEKSN